MKKGLLSLACVSALSATANNSLGSLVLVPDNSVTSSGIVSEESASRNNPMVYDADKSLFVAGVFDTDFEGLEAIAASSYIIKKNSSLQAVWKVAIKGAATVTSLLSDGEGGVYAVGTIADEVEFTGTDGNTIVKEGLQDWGAYTTNQCVSFIAHFDAEGKLLNVGTITPEIDPALAELGMYFPEDGDVYCKINSIVKVGDKLYASALYTNKISTSDNSESLTSGYTDIWGMGFMFQANNAAVIIELDKKLEAKSFPFHIKSADRVEDAQQVNSVTMSADASDIYLGVVATGSEYYSSFGTTGEFTFSNDGMGTVGYGHIVFKINPETNTTSASTWENATDELFQINFIKSVKPAGDNLIVAGTFNSTLAFDETKTPVGADDMYVVSLSKSDLSLNWATVTNFDEGLATQKEEIFTGLEVSGNNIYLSGYGAAKADHALETPLSYILNAETGDIKAVNDDNYTFGVAATLDGSKIATAYSAGEPTSISFSDFNIEAAIEAGIEDVYGDASVNVVAYPNPATDILNFSQICNVEIFTIDGKSVTSAYEVSSVDVRALNAGIYFAVITVDGKTSTVKVIKK